ncbi:MAG: N-acetylmuramoyl-L-alanine amidase [Verrucomicrobia bacterium]|nr:N-acetylmuramoyl-L-alanine amidase [Verrucomicrobiota bacterium]
MTIIFLLENRSVETFLKGLAKWIRDLHSPSVLGCCPVAAGLLFLLLSRAVAFDWTITKFDNRDYLPLDQIARFYSFTQADLTSDIPTLSGATLRLQGGVNSRELYLNGLKFILSFPIIRVGDKVLMSRMDLSKLVEPVLRPAKIRGSPVHTIVLDPGHGGFDQGAQSQFGSEKDFALDVALRARQLLVRFGYNVRLTRASDVFVPLEERAMYANSEPAAVFISIHFNAGAREDASGIETYTLAPRGVPSSNDDFLSLADFRPCVGNLRDGENIALASAMHSALITRIGGPDRGIKRARFVVLRDILIPGVLVEGGFLTSPQDQLRIATPAYRQLLAEAISQGVRAYSRAIERGNPDVIAKRDYLTPESPKIWDPANQNVYALPEPKAQQ